MRVRRAGRTPGACSASRRAITPRARVLPPSLYLHRELNALKPTAVPWMYDVSTCAPQEALRTLDTAFAHVFRRVTLKQHGKLRGKLGHPQRKSRKRGRGSFRLSGSISVFADAVQLPRPGAAPAQSA